jgi:ELWxxDGT repeat protein
MLIKAVGTQSWADLQSLEVAGNLLYFSAEDGTHGRELWRSDGTVGGTYMVKDIKPINNWSSYPTGLTGLGDILYFGASDGNDDEELWRSDGTEGGTYQVKNINPNGSSNPRSLIVLDNVLYFRAFEGNNGYELWRSDGTPEAECVKFGETS